MRIDTRHEPHISKKACRNCNHGAAIHHHVKAEAPCNYPGCKCKDYIEPPKHK